MKSDLFYIVDVLYNRYKQDKLTQEEHRRSVEEFFRWLGEDIKSMPFYPFYTKEGKELEKRLEERVQEVLKKLGAKQDVKDVMKFLLCVITDGYSGISVRFTDAVIALYLAEKKAEIKRNLADRYEECSKAIIEVDADYIRRNIDEVLRGIEAISKVAYLTIDRYVNNKQELENDLKRLREEMERKLAEKKSSQSSRSIREKSLVKLLVTGLVALLILILVAILIYTQSQPEQPQVQPQELKGQ